jgi:hypothetical protein
MWWILKDGSYKFLVLINLPIFFKKIELLFNIYATYIQVLSSYLKMLKRSLRKLMSKRVPKSDSSPNIDEVSLVSPINTVNPYISSCVDLETTALQLLTVTRLGEYGKSNDTHDLWFKEIYTKLYDYVNRDMKPTFDEIDAMLSVCRIILSRDMKDEIAEFILNCPEKFLLAYANNSETSEWVFEQLSELGLNNICGYLLQYVHSSKFSTWNERMNVHIR